MPRNSESPYQKVMDILGVLLWFPTVLFAFFTSSTMMSLYMAVPSSALGLVMVGFRAYARVMRNLAKMTSQRDQFHANVKVMGLFVGSVVLAIAVLYVAEKLFSMIAAYIPVILMLIVFCIFAILLGKGHISVKMTVISLAWLSIAYMVILFCQQLTVTSILFFSVLIMVIFNNSLRLFL